MSTLSYLSLVGLGVLFLVLSIVVFWDINIIEKGKESISRMIFLASLADPIVAVAIAAPVFFVIGVLFGHWFFPQSK